MTISIRLDIGGRLALDTSILVFSKSEFLTYYVPTLRGFFACDLPIPCTRAPSEWLSYIRKSIGPSFLSTETNASKTALHADAESAPVSLLKF